MTGRRARRPLSRASGRARAASFAAALSCLLLGCVSALKEPRPLADLAGGAPPPAPEEIAALLAQAETLFAERGVESAREAARLFLRAASAEEAPVDALHGAARAQVWLTDHEIDARERERAALAAVEVAQWCGRKAPVDPACDYWLGAALGVQARERPSTALSALPRIEALFRRAAATYPTLDEAGPERALALLYVRAPGWPTGIGDPDLGLRHARTALLLRPGYLPNRLALAEALLATGERDAALEAYREALRSARAMAEAGDRDAPEWAAEAERALRDAGAG